MSTTRTMNRIALVTAITLSCLGGCDNTPNRTGLVEDSGSIGLPYSSGDRPGLDWGAVYFVGKRLVVWTDGSGAAANDVVGSNGITGKGQVESFNNETVGFSFSLPWDEPGTVTMNGNTYKLDDGVLLLVSFDEQGPRIKQLKRDFTKMQMKGDSLVPFMQDDLDFKEFFGEKEPPTK